LHPQVALMLFASLFRRNDLDDVALRLYAAIVEQARRPGFYAAFGVPDTLDGRFELIALHAFLVLNRLKVERARTEDLAQRLFDTMFRDMDRGLREIGVGDLAVGKHVKMMAKSFYGRVVAYERGLAEGTAVLGEGLARNVYGTIAAPRADDVTALAGYVARSAAGLADQPVEALLAGEARFAAPPEGR
jgi:cytochrome b pre-mRNA-processing protein 3